MKHKQRKPASYQKYSEAVMAFAAPLCDRHGHTATKEGLEQALQLVTTIWNAVVLDEVDGSNQRLAMLNVLAASDPLLAEMANFLVDRKKTIFADDQWLIGECKLINRDGDWSLRVEARDPRQRSNAIPSS